jgi:hypothetical protein
MTQYQELCEARAKVHQLKRHLKFIQKQRRQIERLKNQAATLRARIDVAQSIKNEQVPTLAYDHNVDYPYDRKPDKVSR